MDGSLNVGGGVHLVQNDGWDIKSSAGWLVIQVLPLFMSGEEIMTRQPNHSIDQVQNTLLPDLTAGQTCSTPLQTCSYPSLNYIHR